MCKTSLIPDNLDLSRFGFGLTVSKNLKIMSLVQFLLITEARHNVPPCAIILINSLFKNAFCLVCFY